MNLLKKKIARLKTRYADILERENRTYISL